MAFARAAKIKRILVIRTTANSVLTLADVEVFEVDPGATPILPFDGDDTILLVQNIIISAQNGAGFAKLINMVWQDGIMFQSGSGTNIYVAIRGTAGGAADVSDIFTVVIDGEVEND